MMAMTIAVAETGMNTLLTLTVSEIINVIVIDDRKDS